jgi:hypothetical protein
MLTAFGIDFHVALFCAFFIMVRIEHHVTADKFDTWVDCLLSFPDDTDRCLPETGGLGPSEGLVFACFLLLGVSLLSLSILIHAAI